MYTLTIGNNQLILDSDFSPSLTYKNPAWCFGELPGPLCLDVTIPDNDINRNYLGFPGRFAKVAKKNDRKFPKAELRWNGYLYIYGTLVITKTDEKRYSGYIQSELRSLSDAQQEKLIGNHNLLGELTFVNKTNYDPATDNYCTIRLSNDGFWTDKGEQETVDNETRSVLTRKFRDTVESVVNATTIDGVKVSAADSEVVVVSPFPFLHKLIELLLRENKLFVRNDFLRGDADLKTLCLYHNVSICEPTSVLLPVETWYYFDYFDNDGNAVINNYKIDSVIETQTWETANFKLKKLLPKMKLNELILSIQNLTNSFYHFSGIDDVDNIDRESLFDMTPFDLSKYRISRWLPGTRQNLCLKFKFSHDSDDQIFNENFTDISSREDDIKEAVQTYPDLLLITGMKIGNIRLVIAEKKYYEYRQETIEDEAGKSKNVIIWAILTVDIQDYKYNPTGDESENIETMFSTLLMKLDGQPIALQKGNNSQFSQYTENFSPRLLFYNGNNTGGSTSSSGLSIDWKSLVATRYRRTAPFYANALPIEADFRFPGNILYKVLNEIYKPYLDRDGSFFIKELQISSATSEFVNATLTVFKNEDNVFESTADTVTGGGEHFGNLFTPMFIGVTENGWPILINAQGIPRPMPDYGNLSTVTFANKTCVEYNAAYKQLFVGGNNGQLHVCDLSDMENLRYKTIQVFAGTDEISAVAICNNILFIGRACSPPIAYVVPMHANFDDYANGAIQLAPFNSSSDFIRSFMYADGWYYACNTGGELFRSENGTVEWAEVFDTHSEYIKIGLTASRIWLVELNEDLMYSLRSDPTHFNRFGGLAGDPLQHVRDLQPLLNDQILYLCDDDAACIFKIDPGVSNANITPNGIKSAGGACFDGTKYAYISVKDWGGYTKIATYNDNVVGAEVIWSYLNVQAFFSKLFLY